MSEQEPDKRMERGIGDVRVYGMVRRLHKRGVAGLEPMAASRYRRACRSSRPSDTGDPRLTANHVKERVHYNITAFPLRDLTSLRKVS